MPVAGGWEQTAAKEGRVVVGRQAADANGEGDVDGIVEAPGALAMSHLLPPGAGGRRKRTDSGCPARKGTTALETMGGFRVPHRGFPMLISTSKNALMCARQATAVP